MASPPQAADLVIDVRGIETAAGVVRYAVYDNAAHFPGRDGRIAKGDVPARGDSVRIRVPGLAPGAYAVAVFHDENGNGAFDQGLFGIPLERYGFSNDAQGFFGPPDFETARVALDEPEREIVITLHR